MTTLLHQHMQNITVVVDDETVAKSISEAIEMIKSTSHDKIIDGVRKIRKAVVVEPNPPIDKVLKAGGLTLLVNCLKLCENI